MSKPMTDERLKELASHNHNHEGDRDGSCFACVLDECVEEILSLRKEIEELEESHGYDMKEASIVASLGEEGK